MKESYETTIQRLKERPTRWRSLFMPLILGALALVLLCGVVNFAFFAAGIALANIWPFPPPVNTTSPHMIAAYHVNEISEPLPMIEDFWLYSQAFGSHSLTDWQTLSDGWDVQNGVYYGSNSRADVRAEAVYAYGYGWDNYAVEADVMAMGSAYPSSAGLLFRVQESGYTGHCRLGTRVTGGREIELVTPEGRVLVSSFHFVSGEPYRLRATAVQNTLTCEILNYPDTRLTASTTVLQGTVGFQNSTITGAFDNLEVTQLP